MLKLIDLSHTIQPGMPLFSTDAPQPNVSARMSHSQAAKSGNYEDCTCEISEVNFVTSIGTYIDSPYHFDPEGESIEEIALEQVVLPGLVIPCTHVEASEGIGPEILEGHNIFGKAILINTGWSRYWGQSIYKDFPFLVEETAIRLRDEGAKLVGVDCLIIDNPNDPRRPVHTILLKNDILIIENLTNLNSLPTRGFVFHAVPVKFKGAAAFPVRAYAVAQ
jgi:kynurenine formamidase